MLILIHWPRVRAGWNTHTYTLIEASEQTVGVHVKPVNMHSNRKETHNKEKIANRPEQVLFRCFTGLKEENWGPMDKFCSVKSRCRNGLNIQTEIFYQSD